MGQDAVEPTPDVDFRHRLETALWRAYRASGVTVDVKEGARGWHASVHMALRDGTAAVSVHDYGRHGSRDGALRALADITGVALDGPTSSGDALVSPPPR